MIHQSSALKADEENELLQEPGQSDMESPKQGCQFQTVRWSALATVCALALVGAVNMMGSKGIAVADVAATVGLSWDSHIDELLKNCKGQCDSAVIIGLNGGAIWTGTADADAKHLKITKQEAATVASNMKEGGPGDFPGTGILVEGTKYMYLKQCNGILTGKFKGKGAISLAKTDTAIIIARTPEKADFGQTNMAVQSTVAYFKSMKMRRLMRGGDTAEYARRLHDEDMSNIVVDMDSDMIRAGFAGDDAPKVTEPPEGDDFKPRLEQVYDKLEADASKQVVLISDTPLTPPETQKKWTQILFEDFKVPGMYLANKAALAAAAQGVTTAVVLYIASDAVYSVPIYEFVALDHATIRQSNDEKSAEKFAGMVYESIMKTDVDMRKELYANVVIAGDDTLGDSLKEKLAALAPPAVKINVRSEDEETKALTPWIGGSILASLSSFRFITDDMYAESGPDVVVNTCF